MHKLKRFVSSSKAKVGMTLTTISLVWKLCMFILDSVGRGQTAIDIVESKFWLRVDLLWAGVLAIGLIMLVWSIHDLKAHQTMPQAEPTSPTLSVPEKRTTRQDNEERHIVDVTPQYLTGLFANYTSLQAKKLADDYMNKWMRVTGVIRDIDPSDPVDPCIRVQFLVGSELILLVFSEDWKDRLAVMRQGTRITALGQIHDVFRQGMVLENCEVLEEKKPTEKKPKAKKR